MKLKGKWRKRILFIHKLLGLITGIVVVIVSISGAAWVFKEEVEGLDADYKTVTPVGEYSLTASQANVIAKDVFPSNHIHGVLFGSKNESVEVIFYDESPAFYQSVFINPYSHQVIFIKNHFSGFFNFFLNGHKYLWLPHAIGSNIVKYSIILFLIIIISGFFLWVPSKGKKAVKQRLSFDWKNKTKWKRKNFDLHTVLGFYVYVFAFIFAFTGSIIGLPWFYYIVFKSIGGESDPRFVTPNNVSSVEYVSNNIIKPIDKLIPKLRIDFPNANTYELHYPDSDTACFYVEMDNTKGVFYDNDFRFFDQRTLEEVPTNSIYSVYEDADFSDSVIRMSYDIHIGSIGGLVGKIIAFFTSLIVGSLPITGFLIWWGKKNKASKFK